MFPKMAYELDILKLTGIQICRSLFEKIESHI